jgi:hypothetical protein
MDSLKPWPKDYFIAVDSRDTKDPYEDHYFLFSLYRDPGFPVDAIPADRSIRVAEFTSEFEMKRFKENF